MNKGGSHILLFYFVSLASTITCLLLLSLSFPGLIGQVKEKIGKHDVWFRLIAIEL